MESAHLIMKTYKSWSHLVREGVKDPPEEFLGEEQLFLGGDAEAAHP